MKRLKDLLVIMKEHTVLDNLIQGQWWENGKGCFYGCPMQTDERAIEKACETYGIPLWVGYWSEQVFEGLPIKDAKLWPVKLLEAMIEFKGDYEDVKHKLAVKRLTYLSERATGKVKTAIDGVIKYHITRDESLRVGAESKAWLVAESESWSKAWLLAESESWSVAALRSTRSAANSAGSTSSSAAGSAAESAAESPSAEVEAWQRERDWMLDILEQGE